MSSPQTDNSFFTDKVRLRLNHLPEKQHIRVLDAFGGDGRIWSKIKNTTSKEIEVLRIDQKSTAKGIYLKGDNTKYLMSLDLKKYDVIDLDAYGVPYKQLNAVFDYFSKQKSSYEIICHVTFIQTMQGGLPHKLLRDIGYSKTMIEKIPTLFSRNGIEKLKRYLYINGVQSINIISSARKHYLCFVLEKP